MLADLLSKMLSAEPKDRPSAEECLRMLGPEWERRLSDLRTGKTSRGKCGTCGEPVYSNDKGRFRDARGIYFHAACSQSDMGGSGI